MSWPVLLVLAGGCYGWKLLGSVVAARGTAARAAALVPVALLSAIVVVQTVGGDRRLEPDARLAGLAAAVLLQWRRAPLVLVVAGAAAVTAAVRALT